MFNMCKCFDMPCKIMKLMHTGIESDFLMLIDKAIHWLFSSDYFTVFLVFF